ncbi:MAG: hypothetical protein ACR2MP_01540 [Streptosporangiaceae bacterium]
MSVEQLGADPCGAGRSGSRIVVLIGQTAREGETVLDRLGFGLGGRQGLRPPRLVNTQGYESRERSG